jgi:hypothetical protein
VPLPAAGAVVAVAFGWVVVPGAGVLFVAVWVLPAWGVVLTWTWGVGVMIVPA